MRWGKRRKWPSKVVGYNEASEGTIVENESSVINLSLKIRWKSSKRSSHTLFSFHTNAVTYKPQNKTTQKTHSLRAAFAFALPIPRFSAAAGRWCIGKSCGLLFFLLIVDLGFFLLIFFGDLMASEDVKTSESAVSKIVNLAEEAKLAKEEIKPTKYQVYSICKSLIAGGVAGGVWVPYLLSIVYFCWCEVTR